MLDQDREPERATMAGAGSKSEDPQWWILWLIRWLILR